MEFGFTEVRIAHCKTGRFEPPMRVRAILRLAANHSRQDRLIVLGMGPATDIASALLIEPRLADRIEVVALAFDRYPEGGDGWNVRNDIRAWQILLASRTPITVASVRLRSGILLLREAGRSP